MSVSNIENFAIKAETGRLKMGQHTAGIYDMSKYEMYLDQSNMLDYPHTRLVMCCKHFIKHDLNLT